MVAPADQLPAVMTLRLSSSPPYYSSRLGGSCTGPTPVNTLGELDYTELTDDTGWRLRIYGNGSGSISHDQLPAYHLHYPRAYVCARAAAPPGRSHGLNPPADGGPCTRLAYYSARLDSTLHCTCVSATMDR